ncbi:hypothetical protein ACN6LF_002020, partial [[Kitasatospora] papulosa]
MSSRPLPSSTPSRALPPASIAVLALFSLLASIVGAAAVSSFPRAPAVSFRVLVYSGGAHGPRGTIRAGPGSGASATATTAGSGGLTVARMPSGGGRRMHRK